MYSSSIEVGKRIFDSRKRLGYTRERLAELSEISVQFLADIEKGRKSMTVGTLRRIAEALNVSPDYIVNGKNLDTDNARICTMLSSLSEFERQQAEKLLAVFVEAVKGNNIK